MGVYLKPVYGGTYWFGPSAQTLTQFSSVWSFVVCLSFSWWCEVWRLSVSVTECPGLVRSRPVGEHLPTCVWSQNKSITATCPPWKSDHAEFAAPTSDTYFRSRIPEDLTSPMTICFSTLSRPTTVTQNRCLDHLERLTGACSLHRRREYCIPILSKSLVLVWCKLIHFSWRYAQKRFLHFRS